MSSALSTSADSQISIMTGSEAGPFVCRVCKRTYTVVILTLSCFQLSVNVKNSDWIILVGIIAIVSLDHVMLGLIDNEF